ncbi:hypothetical protein [Methylosinus sp. Sm6]|uniref:hypothetical protein n=1 Tax=Methylosinus sp. Sm6 TaxID=2866948 RepID=UPI001C9A0BB5|nr:hypothetical protein [Methylosinus sp. Sm6]MBY6243937.1 hypothetical protein [Methylosinus sp. Sm6]
MNWRDLPDRPKYDFVDFMMRVCDIEESVLERLTAIPTFLAAIAGYTYHTGPIRLGYAGFFCWAQAKFVMPPLTEEKLLDYVRVVSYRRKLAEEDSRFIAIDYLSAKSDFPELFKIETLPLVGPERANHSQHMLREMGAFALGHAFREQGYASIRSADESDYLDYWMARSEDEIADFLSNPRVLAGLDAMGLDRLSFHGFIERVYGNDYCDNVLRAKNYVLFSDLRADLNAFVVGRLAVQVRSGLRTLPPDLQIRYPEIYEGYYKPELFGARQSRPS